MSSSLRQPDLFDAPITAPDTSALPAEVWAILAVIEPRIGGAQAIDAAEIATAAGIMPDSSREVRRTRVRTLLADHFEALPFLIVADTRGYYRPASFDEARHYIATLVSRTDSILVRLESCCHHLSRTNWRTYSPSALKIDAIRKHLSSLQ